MANDKLLKLEIVTPQKVLYSGDVVSVTVPGSKSPFQVLFNHAPIVSSLDTGLVKIVDEQNNTKYYAVSPGFTEVHGNKISILVDKAEEPSRIDSEATRSAIENFKNMISSDISPDEKQKVKLAILFEEAKLKAVEKSKAV
jgi:F-type H+-transporting ATPase subunit epsilon